MIRSAFRISSHPLPSASSFRAPAHVAAGSGKYSRGIGAARPGRLSRGHSKFIQKSPTRTETMPSAVSSAASEFIMSSSTQGVAAALGAPLAMAMAFFLWDGNWKGSSFMLNLFKCGLATAVFVLVGVLNGGPSEWFASATWPTACWLLLSGFIGIVVGDTASLQSLRLIGAKRYIMIDSLRPFISSLFGWLFLDNPITVGLVAGMAITTSGVLMVSLERENASHDTKGHITQAEATLGAHGCDSPLLEPAQPPPPPHHGDTANEKVKRPAVLALGYCLAVLHAVLDVTGSLITRQVGSQYSSMEINTIRFGSSAVLLGAVAAFASAFRWVRGERGTEDAHNPAMQNNSGCHWSRLPCMSVRGWGLVGGGALLGTFVCPWLGVLSLFKISFPVFATLSSLAPVYCLPLAWFMFRQRITARGAVGSLLAFLGVIPLYFSA